MVEVEGQYLVEVEGGQYLVEVEGRQCLSIVLNDNTDKCHIFVYVKHNL